MKRIAHYTPPTPADLSGLKRRLELTSAQLADLANLPRDHWRKYTSPAGGRSLSVERHFLIAALMALDDESLAKVVATMREHGADIDLAPLKHEKE